MADVYVSNSGNDTTGTGSSVSPYATPGKAAGVMSGSDQMCVKNGTYTFTTTTTNVAGGLPAPPAGSSGAPTRVTGYNVTLGDLDDVNDFSNFPTIAGSASGSTTACLYLPNSYVHVKNLILDGATFANRGLYVAASFCRGENLKLTRTANGALIDGTFFRGFRLGATGCGIGAYCDAGNCTFTASVATACTTAGFVIDNAATMYAHCLAYANTGSTVDGFKGVNGYGSLYFGCTSYGNGRDGIRLNDSSSADAVQILGCILASNGGYGANSQATAWSVGSVNYNAFYNNTSGLRNNLPTGSLDVTLTGNPFTNAGSGDFSLNNTAGAGAACRAAGYPGVLPFGLTIGYRDIGVVQHQDAGGGGTSVALRSPIQPGSWSYIG